MQIEWNTVSGKIRRQRNKLHLPAKNDKSTGGQKSLVITDSTQELPLSSAKGNIFAGLNIDIDNIKTSLTVSDDQQSVKSHKSFRSESVKPILPKKDKVKLRRESFLRKLDTVNQIKKEKIIRKKREKIALIGDTNPLHDALPSLESLKLKADIKYNPMKNRKRKGIEKATQRKKKLVEGVKIYKYTLKNKDFQKNPFQAISNHIKAMVQYERTNKL